MIKAWCYIHKEITSRINIISYSTMPVRKETDVSSFEAYRSF